MQLNNVKLYRPIPNIIVPPIGFDNKNVCFAFLAENHSFLDVYRYLNIKSAQVRFVFVPTTMKPRTYLTPQYKRDLMDHKLRPYKGMFGIYDNMVGHNFYLEFNGLINFATIKYRFKKFHTGRAATMLGGVINTLSGVPSESFHRILLYSVNLDKPFQPVLRRRKIFLIYSMLLETLKTGEALPFDKLLMFFFDHSGGRYILLYDKDYPININRVKNILLKMETTDIQNTEDEEYDNMADEAIDKTPETENTSEKTKEKLIDNVKNFITSDPVMSVNKTVDNINPSELTNAAIAYHITGDVDKAKTIAKAIETKPPSEKKEITKQLLRTHSKNLLPRPKAVSSATDLIIKMSEPAKLVENQVPTHILEKRKKDFSELLQKDLMDTFKPLEKEELYLKVKSMDVRPVQDPVSELKQTLKNRYTIVLEDDMKRKHKVEIDLPHLTDDGTFIINGQPKVLVNQLIAYPIFFFKPYHGRFETSYATININSKHLKTTSYLQMYLSGYKLPIICFFGYKIGFDRTMQMFNIKYQVHEDRRDDAIKLPNGEYISFQTNNPTGKEIIESFKFTLVSFPANVTINDSNFWRDVIINMIGTRNGIYPIDQVWKYIVTPVAAEVLESHGDPTTLEGILKYICDEVVKGTVDDRNSLDKQRIRTSEVFTHQIQKQIIAAYNEYLAKRLGGDDTARININSTKAFSDVANSQNVQQLESITPLEELSMMTRITPVGIGGIPDKRALPAKAMNTHYTYYGNIDPLETPDGPMVGIQQHLTVGAAIANARGTFTVKDRSMVKPTEIISVGPAMVPFVESNDGCRVIMGTGQSKQAVPLIDSEPPAVQSGYESLLAPLLSSNFIKKSPVDGKILKVDRDIIIVQDEKTGKQIPIDIKPKVLKSGAGKHGLSVFKTKLLPGQKVKVGEIIAEGANIRNGMISNGINLLTAYMSWDGYNFEDGVVISESAASRFTSIHTIEETLYLEEDDDVLFIANIGDEIEKGGIVLTYSKAIYDVESYKHLRSEGGIISNIEIFVNTENVSEKLLPIYNSFKSHFITINGKYPQGEFREKGEKIEGTLIRFTMEQHLHLGKGDKMNNRHGNKGVIAIVEKDENMPLTPWGDRVDLVLNTLGVPGRMNTGQICELHTGLVAKELANRIQKMDREKFTSLYQRVLTFMDGTNNKDYSKSVIQKTKAMSDEQYKKMVSQIKECGFMSIIAVPFKSPTRDDILKALSILGLKPRYPLKLHKHGDMVTDPVAVGYIYEQKLEHMSAKKIASRGVGPYVSTTLAPTAGKKHGGGQQLGENDLYGLLAWDTPVVIDEFFGPLSSDHVTKNEMISEIIQTGKTNFKEYKTNPVKDRMSAYMLAIHLKSE